MVFKLIGHSVVRVNSEGTKANIISDFGFKISAERVLEIPW
jgi:hypothetical protein